MIPHLTAEDSPGLKIARLERRLAREREARQAAETIAETTLRDLYREQQRLALVETIATAANLDDDPPRTFALALRAICDFTGWKVGQAYMFADGAPEGPLVFSGVWHDPEPNRRAAFRQTSERLAFDRGLGLPGRVWESGKACWIEDITLDPHFPRADAAIDAGLRAAFAFPALMGEEVGAVLEFFLERPAPPDERLLHTLDQIGAQLGRVIERYRHARRVEAHTRALEEKTAAAEAASRAKSSFLAVTSHEVRTPLNAVLGLAQALRREPLTERQHELNDGVLASGAMLLRLLNAVLDMSSIEADRAIAVLGDFDLRAKLESVVAIWTPRAAEAGVALSLDFTCPADAMVRSDEGRLEQTLVNLISNALKFTPSGDEVTVRAVCGEDRLRLEVVDGGPGVAPEDRERIFQPFEQTEAGRQAGGAGLGLAICAGNVALLGGEIGCRPGPLGGECFWFEIPVTLASGAEGFASMPAPPVTDGAALKVLAAEDNAANRHVLRVLLEPTGVDLIFAENGQEAIDALAETDFDLVLMDVNMPVMDGVEAVGRIRAAEGSGRHTPIHMLTANAFAEDIERYLAGGADGVLTKPIQLPQLFAVLQACQPLVSRAA